MNIKELEYFKTICEEKSITKAARQLYITPQGLSRTIKNLEYEFQTKLLNRNTTGITLTEAGKYLYDHLSDFLGQYYDLYNGIQKIKQYQNHEIDLLSAYGILRLVTPECIRAFTQKHPEITLHYREYPDRQVERLFLAKEGNVAFTVGPTDLSNFNAQLMEQFEIKLLVNRRHPLSQKSSVTILDLKDQPLYIEGSEFNIHHLIVRKCQEAGFSPNIIFETSGFSLCHKMVQQNKGISVTVDFIFDDMSSADLVMIPFSDDSYRWSTYMITRKDEETSPDIMLFQQHIMDWLQAIKDKKYLR
ncbi:MAG: LysR family transcriptional regulator [Blautia sp.]|jgi:DNA-binding transcriptional LysR family regulator